MVLGHGQRKVASKLIASLSIVPVMLAFVNNIFKLILHCTCLFYAILHNGVVTVIQPAEMRDQRPEERARRVDLARPGVAGFY